MAKYAAEMYRKSITHVVIINLNRPYSTYCRNYFHALSEVIGSCWHRVAAQKIASYGHTLYAPAMRDKFLIKN